MAGDTNLSWPIGRNLYTTVFSHYDKDVPVFIALIVTIIYDL
jgi:hypothetical protein